VVATGAMALPALVTAFWDFIHAARHGQDYGYPGRGQRFSAELDVHLEPDNSRKVSLTTPQK